MRKPCKGCGGPKPPGRGLSLCAECKEVAEWRQARKKQALGTTKRKRCRGCGRPKGPGRGLVYCAACQQKLAQPRMCRMCGENPVRAAEMQYCQECYAISRERRAWQKRKHKAKTANALTRRMMDRKYRERMFADPERHARFLETRRLRYRMAAQREGRQVRTGEWNGNGKSRGSLPGWPLAVMIEHLAESSDIATICEAAGINERLHTAWRRHERSVSLEIADRVLTALDLLWWDVWSEETLRLPLFVVRQYVSALKKQPDGSHIRRRLCIRVVPYGDAGADTGRLEEIRALMVGESREAIAA